MFDWVDYPEKPSETYVGYGHYHELYEKGSDGRWRIKRMQLKRIDTLIALLDAFETVLSSDADYEALRGASQRD